MRRRFFVAIGYIGALCAYGYAVVLMDAHNARARMPQWWSGHFPSRTMAVLAGSYIELIVLLVPALGLLRKLPSNNRWRGP
jgi:hypothetical protein